MFVLCTIMYKIQSQIQSFRNNQDDIENKILKIKLDWDIFTAEFFPSQYSNVLDETKILPSQMWGE